MNPSPLKASEVEALTFIYTPRVRAAQTAAGHPWVSRSGALGMAIAWVLLAGLAWVELAGAAVPESYGL